MFLTILKNIYLRNKLEFVRKYEKINPPVFLKLWSIDGFYRRNIGNI